MKHSGKWSKIHVDVFELILERLCLVDYLRIIAVCSSWRALVVKAITNKSCPPAPQLPLLLLQASDKIVDFFDLTTESLSHSIKLPFLCNRICHGSIEGWMIMSDISYASNAHLKRRAIFFWNPVTTAEVRCPSLINYPTASHRIIKIVASSKPTNPYCLVVILFDDFYHLAFTRISDKSWTIIEGDMDAGISFMEMEILDGRLYVLTDKALHSILVYDLQEPNDPPNPKILAKLPEIRPTPFVSAIGSHRVFLFGNIINYLAIDAASGEILLVYVFYRAVYTPESVGYMNIVTDYISPPEVTALQVFKLEKSRSEPPRWVEARSLGSRLLFVGCHKNLVMSTTALRGPEDLIRANTIYFTLVSPCPSDPWRGMQIGKFCLTDGSFKYFSLEKETFVTVPCPDWFIPNVW